MLKILNFGKVKLRQKNVTKKSINILLQFKKCAVTGGVLIFKVQQHSFLGRGSEHPKSEHQKFFTLIRTSKVKKITTLKDHNIERSERRN
jgi:hypothetical protein